MTSQEIFDKLALDLSPLLSLPRIADVAYNVDPFLKGTMQTKKFLESLGVKWWISTDANLWLIMDLQEVAREPKSQQLDSLKFVAFEYGLHTAAITPKE